MFKTGKTLINVIGYIFCNFRKEYVIYIILCILEVGKSIAIIMLSYFGVSVITNFGVENLVASIMCGIVGVISELSLLLLNRQMNCLEKKIEIDIHEKIVRKASKLKWIDLMDNDIQKILTDGICEGKQAVATLTVDMPSYVKAILFITFYFVFVFRISWWMPFVILGGVCFIVFFSTKMQEKEYEVLEELAAVQRRRYYHIHIPFLEKVHREVTVQTANEYVSQKRNEANDLFYQEKLRVINLKTKLNIGGNLILFFVSFFLFFFAAILLEHDDITIQDFLSLLVSGLVLFTEINGLREMLEWDKSALYHVKNYLVLMNLSEDTKRDNSRIEKIEVTNISFSYGDNRVLDRVSFKMKRGDKILILGENGAGKSTLLNILGGLISIERGRIVVNDNMIIEDGEIFKGRVAYVSQNMSPLKLTFKENLFSPLATDSEIEDVLKKVGLWESINKMQQGINTLVGEGSSLSKGQWQRFAIARLLLRKDADVWILDEPTASMDALHEGEMLNMLFHEGKDKTIIVVTHRMTMARQMDNILFLNCGKIQYAGTHKELYENIKAYREIYDMQAKMYPQKV